jgi:hypothetical protein
MVRLPPPERDTQIRVASDGIHVTEFDAREAAVFCHYNWTEFQELTQDEKAACIAHYRIHIAIESHTHDAYKPRRGGRRGR